MYFDFFIKLIIWTCIEYLVVYQVLKMNVIVVFFIFVWFVFILVLFFQLCVFFEFYYKVLDSYIQRLFFVLKIIGNM